MESDSRRRAWILGCLVAYAAATALVLFSPLSPGLVIEGVTAWVQQGLGLTMVRQGWIEFGANIVLFVPLGFLLTLAFRRAWIGVVLALVLSVAAELIQIVLPARLASPRDIIANVLGACIGVGLAWVFFVRRRSSAASATAASPTSASRD